MKISLPYGNEMVGMEVPDQCFIGMIDPPEAQPAGDPERRWWRRRKLTAAARLW